MDSEQLGFLSTLWTANDATPWLIYADWLEERGDRFAEWIRMWLDPRHGQHGLLPKMTAETHLEWYQRPDYWLLSWPTERKRVSEALTRSDERFDWHNQKLGNGGLSALAAHPVLETKRELALSYNQISAAGIIDLAQSPWVRSLRWLDLSWNEIGDAGARAFALSPYLSDLEMLDLSYGYITDAGGVALAESSTLPPRLRLRLECNPRLSEPTRRALRRKYPQVSFG